MARQHARRRREEAAARAVWALAAPVEAVPAWLHLGLRHGFVDGLDDGPGPMAIGDDAAHVQTAGNLPHVVAVDHGAIGCAAAMRAVDGRGEVTAGDPVGIAPLVMRPPADDTGDIDQQRRGAAAGTQPPTATTANTGVYSARAQRSAAARARALRPMSCLSCLLVAAAWWV